MIEDALPPELHEVINGAIAATGIVLLVVCLRYLLTVYLHYRSEGNGRWRSFLLLRQMRLAVGATILLVGLVPLEGWLWWARYGLNTGRDVDWMGRAPWVYVPIAAGVAMVLGLACKLRALAPIAWGRFGYWAAIGVAVAAVVASQVWR